MTNQFLDDPVLRAALIYWCRKRASRSMPSKRDLDPTDMPPRLLPNLELIEVLPTPERFRYRLVGTAIVRAFGREYTGKCPADILPPDRVRFIRDIYDSVCETKHPLFSRNKYLRSADLHSIVANRVYLPLSDDGISVRHILAALSFDYSAFTIAGVWGVGALDPSLQYTKQVDLAVVPGFA